MPLLYFILGAVFVYFIMPIGEGLMGVIMSFFELLKAKINVKIVKCNEEMHDTIGSPKPVVGFVAKEDDDD